MATYPFPVRLDRKFCLEGVYSIGDDETVFTLPIFDDSLTSMVLSSDFGDDAGTIIEVLPVTDGEGGSTITLSGDYSAGVVTVGRPYTMRVDLSRPYTRDAGGSANMDTRIELQKILVSHRETGSYTITGSMQNRRNQIASFSSPTPATGVKTAWIGGDAARLTNSIADSSALPLNITAIEYTVDDEPRRG